MKIREDVNRTLEIARQAKTIGNPLGAKVMLRASAVDAALLDRYRDDLPMLFIVSEVLLDTTGAGSAPLQIEVARADGEKCPRCWRFVRSISSAPGTEGLCDRCAEALSRT